ncbi:prolipoprotein diacylglyceryl transferase [Candidatus Gracilibacteria bacterium]|nr:prolipoprotein diacylglyceryl transferase [Candidatus Gracilibacteria bacterium]
MYALGFIICYFFVRQFYNFSKKEHLDTLLIYVFIGIILGGRLGYVILYNLSFFTNHPIEILQIWKGGMSFHGGFIGTTLAVFLFAKRYHYQFWGLIDTLAVIVPVAIGLGRIGNWINRELPGYTPYDGLFPMMIAGVSHFPSPLLEMLLEGIGLTIVMMVVFFGLRKEKPGFYSGVWLIGYSTARLIAEQYRLPDTHIGYLFGTDWVTAGILYTLPMMVGGVYLLMRRSFYSSTYREV